MRSGVLFIAPVFVCDTKPFYLHNICKGAVRLTAFILLTLAVILCILGLAEVIHAIKLYIFSPKKKALTYQVIYLSSQDAENQLRYIGEKYRWQGRRFADNVIAVNNAVNIEDFKLCAEIAEKYNIIYCSAGQLSDWAEMVMGKGM